MSTQSAYMCICTIVYVTPVYVNVCKYLSAHMHTHSSANVHVHVCICVYIYTYIYSTHTHTYIHIYMHAYIHTYLYLFTHTHTHTQQTRAPAAIVQHQQPVAVSYQVPGVMSVPSVHIATRPTVQPLQNGGLRYTYSTPAVRITQTVEQVHPELQVCVHVYTYMYMYLNVFLCVCVCGCVCVLTGGVVAYCAIVLKKMCTYTHMYNVYTCIYV
jgi:hypothetical protein